MPSIVEKQQNSISQAAYDQSMPLDQDFLHFIQQQSVQTPCLVINLQQVIASYRRIFNALPFATCYYAMKVNPAEEIMRALNSEGSHFEAASLSEIEDCINWGIKPEHILFGNPIKKTSDIQKAYAQGIRFFIVDDMNELQKLATYAPGSRILCRLSASGAGAVWPLSHKFGCPYKNAPELLVKAKELGLVPVGVSFHVGSQQIHAGAWERSISEAAQVFREMEQHGITLTTVDIGGGFPVPYRNMDCPSIETLGKEIGDMLRKYFGTLPAEIIMEPGRYLTAFAGTIISEIILISTNRDDGKRWIYLDVGKYNGLMDADHTEYDVVTLKEGVVAPVELAGPTCDGQDVISPKANYCLPDTLEIEDKVFFLNAGAYSNAFACASFNGFAPLTSYFIKE